MVRLTMFYMQDFTRPNTTTDVVSEALEVGPLSDLLN